MLLLDLILSRASSRRGFVIEPSSDMKVSDAPNQTKTVIRTSDVLDGFSFQERLNEIKHGSELREDDRLLSFASLLDLVQNFQYLSDFSRRRR
jgi:hypothetical protein